MKLYKKIILTYVDKYKDVNFDILSKELNVPLINLVEIVQELVMDDYLKCQNRTFFLTEKGKTEIFASWNAIFVTEKEEEDKEDFVWDELYIPDKFKL